MNTPEGFSPAHALPDRARPRGDRVRYIDGRLVVRDAEEAPELPSLADVPRIRHTGVSCTTWASSPAGVRRRSR
jgi:hypothetical protein